MEYFLLTFPATQVNGRSIAVSGTNGLMDSAKTCSGKLAGSRRTTILVFAWPRPGPLGRDPRLEGVFPGLLIFQNRRASKDE